MAVMVKVRRKAKGAGEGSIFFGRNNADIDEPGDGYEMKFDRRDQNSEYEYRANACFRGHKKSSLSENPEWVRDGSVWWVPDDEDPDRDGPDGEVAKLLLIWTNKMVKIKSFVFPERHGHKRQTVAGLGKWENVWWYLVSIRPARTVSHTRSTIN